MAAPYKLHGGNSTTRSLHAWNECTKRGNTRRTYHLRNRVQCLAVGENPQEPSNRYLCKKEHVSLFGVQVAAHKLLGVSTPRAGDTHANTSWFLGPPRRSSALVVARILARASV